jgi:uncharacterized membrane protein
MESIPKTASRLASLDALRGIVVVVMTLDHVRDFFHLGAMSFSPTDLLRTTPLLFFTRWITHFCLPVFTFAAGAGIFLWWRQGKHTRLQLSRFLLTRGLWFIFLELTVMQLAYDFNISPNYRLLLLILWIFGVCLLLMAALVHLPMAWLLGFSVIVIAGHNLLDRFEADRFGGLARFWDLLHQPDVFSVGGKSVLAIYPILPWIAVMTAGFCFAQIFLWEPPLRRRVMRAIGSCSIIAFMALRELNLYGDPLPWAFQKSTVFTVLSFLNCTKYPASLDFLLMTLGPALLVLAYLDRHPLAPDNPLLILGRVPLSYFVLHFYLIHAFAVLAACLRYGPHAFSFIFNPMPSLGGPRDLFPSPFGYSLWVTYLVWLLVVVSLYPLCKWFAGVKSTNRAPWLSYL